VVAASDEGAHLVGSEGDVGTEDDGVALGGGVGVEARYVAVVDGRLVGTEVEEVAQVEEQVRGGHRCLRDGGRRGREEREIREGWSRLRLPVWSLFGSVVVIQLLLEEEENVKLEPSLGL
jgi:hypothetical protein